MFDSASFSLFIITAIVILVIPGPAVLYIIARSLEQGWTAGMVSVSGISIATLVHALAAALGLSAILVSSSLAFNIVKYAGAAYLIYLGIRILMTRQEFHIRGRLKARSLRRIFYEGFIVNLFNPKTALFFFAFLPQFVSVERGSVPMQFFILGCLMALLGFLSDGLWALFAGSVSNWLRTSRSARNAQRYISGSLLVGLGLTTALADPQR